MFNILILGLTSFLTDISSEMVYPLIPLYLTSVLGATPAIVGVIEGLAESMASLLRVFSGYWSDRLQQRKALTIAGYSASVLGKVFLAISTTWPVVLVGRVVDRFGKGIRTAPRDSLIAESAKEGQTGNAFGLHRAMDSAGASVGVLLGYFFFVSLNDGFRAVFLISVIPALLGVAVLFLVREKARPKSESAARPARVPWWHGLRQRWNLLDRRLKLFLAIVLLFTIGNSSNQFLLLRAQNRGFDDGTVILMYLVFNVVYALVSWPAGRLSDRVGRKPLLVAGYLTYGLVYLGFAVVAPTVLWLLFAVYGVYIALTDGVEKALVSDLAPGDLKATMMGLYATVTAIGLLPASLIAGLLWNVFGPAAPFYFGGALGACAAVALAVLI